VGEVAVRGRVDGLVVFTLALAEVLDSFKKTITGSGAKTPAGKVRA
jgi:hypothetical protein